MKYTGPKHRLARRSESNILAKESASLQRRLSIKPGMHGPKGGRRKVSEYGLQLREKQKAKWTYNVSEAQFRKYVKDATKVKGKTGEALLQLLESRLDNVIYRLGFAPSRYMSRQLVSHGHVLVNDKKVNVPSYRVKVGDIMGLSSKAQKIPAVEKLLTNETNVPVSYLESQAAVGKFVRLPEREEIPVDVSEQLVVEYYSR